MTKSYGIDTCPVARTLDLIGERWTILLLRDLLLEGPRRFVDFQASLPGVAPNTLSARLKALEDNGLVQRALYSERPPRVEYMRARGDKPRARSSRRSKRSAARRTGATASSTARQRWPWGRTRNAC